MQIHPLITDSKDLAALCERLSRSSWVAVDTEFMRENTYWPELCLVQIADEHEAAAIDPKAPGLDLTPLLAPPPSAPAARPTAPPPSTPTRPARRGAPALRPSGGPGR